MNEAQENLLTAILFGVPWLIGLIVIILWAMGAVGLGDFVLTFKGAA